MAPRGLPIVLALEIGAALRPTDYAVRNPPADPRDEHRQPVVGSAENPWRASQAWHRHRPDQRGAEEGSSVTRMEGLSFATMLSVLRRWTFSWFRQSRSG